MSELGNRVRAARAYAGDMGQKDLAAKLPFSLSTLQRIETGGRTIEELEELTFVKRVAEATGLPQWFFTINFDQAVEQATARGNEDDPVARLERQVKTLQDELRTFHRKATGDLEKQARGSASDRGRLTKIEQALTRLLVELPDLVNSREGPK